MLNANGSYNANTCYTQYSIFSGYFNSDIPKSYQIFKTAIINLYNIKLSYIKKKTLLKYSGVYRDYLNYGISRTHFTMEIKDRGIKT